MAVLQVGRERPHISERGLCCQSKVTTAKGILLVRWRQGSGGTSLVGNQPVEPGKKGASVIYHLSVMKSTNYDQNTVRIASDTDGRGKSNKECENVGRSHREIQAPCPSIFGVMDYKSMACSICGYKSRQVAVGEWLFPALQRF
jgi:hypothetical protein